MEAHQNTSSSHHFGQVFSILLINLLAVYSEESWYVLREKSQKRSALSPLFSNATENRSWVSKDVPPLNYKETLLISH